jgi:hypothetical protein
MLYAIPDTLLKVAFNINKTNATFNNVSGITYNNLVSFIGVEHYFQQYVMYNI